MSRPIDAYIAALAFRGEHFGHCEALAAELERDAEILSHVELVHQQRKRESGARWAAALGLGPLARVVEVLVYSHSKSARVAAAELIGRRALRYPARRRARGSDGKERPAPWAAAAQICASAQGRRVTEPREAELAPEGAPA